MSTLVTGSGRQVLEVEGKMGDYWDVEPQMYTYSGLSACPQRFRCVGCGTHVPNDEETDRIREILSRLFRKDESDEDE